MLLNIYKRKKIERAKQPILKMKMAYSSCKDRTKKIMLEALRKKIIFLKEAKWIEV